MVEAEFERNGSTSLERRYCLSSMPLDAKLFAYPVRCHWHVENRLHWVLDVVFHEDLSRLRSGAGPQNMATVGAERSIRRCAFRDTPKRLPIVNDPAFQ
jgi:predicted transposase YbfD/YdcC